MNLAKKHIEQICKVVTKAEYLCSVHMSDNAINLYDQEIEAYSQDSLIEKIKDIIGI